ncbi:PEP/pyruvate-binding domain-containing protein [Oryzobacter terrae]|uniref:PEP/pyruvate-binding domain-containing protein n=1 Tax=Oryzobacter terrae TaxID=1620385 RepID=UPI00366F27D6
MGTVDLRDADRACGAKAWHLGVLLRAGLPVPDGVVVTGPVTPDRLRSSPAAALLDAPVAVRSSAPGEDGPDASFAGQLETELGVRGAQDVAAAVARCSSSARSARVLAYAARSGSALPERVPVIVQRLVAAEASGVLVTRHPTTGERVTVVEATWGLGPSVVDGAVVPDTTTVSEEGTVSTRLGDKATRLDLAPDGLVSTAVGDDDRRRPCLPDALALTLAGMGRRCEALLGGPVDVEWAVAGGRVWLLQARPMTALPVAGAPRSVARAPSPGPPVVTGTGSSGGVATGPVRVVRDVDGFSAVRRGDVLVCRTTDPAWTPLFRVVAAVVTETGGLLSHASIVAREVGIPAVVGATGALEVLVDGALATVDGDRGVVTPEEDGR